MCCLAGMCYALLTVLSLNFLRGLVSAKWLRSSHWSGSSAADAAAAQAAQAVLCLASWHDKLLASPNPTLTSQVCPLSSAKTFALRKHLCGQGKCNSKAGTSIRWSSRQPHSPTCIPAGSRWHAAQHVSCRVVRGAASIMTQSEHHKAALCVMQAVCSNHLMSESLDLC